MLELTTTNPPTPPPVPLRPDGAGQRLWDSVLGTYRLRPDELRILEDACCLADDIDYLVEKTAKLRGASENEMMIKGSTGQRVKNPLIAEARQMAGEVRLHRSAMAELMRKLRLPDEFDDSDDDAATRGDGNPPRSASPAV